MKPWRTGVILYNNLQNNKETAHFTVQSQVWMKKIMVVIFQSTLVD